jgi:ADP-ribose pyrophosphatase
VTKLPRWPGKKIIDALPAIARIGQGFLDLKRTGSHALNPALIAAQHHPGVDLCSENGECHTLMTDGPLFKQRMLKDKYGRATMERWLLAPGNYGLATRWTAERGKKKSMSEEKRIESEQLYAGRVVQLRLDTVTLPDGRLKKREILVHPGAAAIVPVLHDKLLLVEQYRTAIGRATLEIPAGTLEVGESPEACARRELIEETGFTAAEWQKLTAYYPSPGYSSELIHVYRASGLEKIAAVNAELPLHWLARSEVQNRIRTGEIQDSKTIIGVLLAR